MFSHLSVVIRLNILSNATACVFVFEHCALERAETFFKFGMAFR